VHDRHVHWYVDTVGGAGKTAFARYVVANKDVFYSRGGKTADIIYGYSGEKVVIFDLVRETSEYFQYGALESLKDGLFYNTKYVCEQRMFQTPHVIVFANWEPATNKLSADRLVLHTIGSASDVELAVPAKI